MKWILFSFSVLFAQAKSIKISLDWFLSPHHIPLILAKDLGFFKKEGLSVSLLASIGSFENCRLLAAGEIDYAIINEAKVKEMGEKGINLQIVFKLIPHSLSVFVSHYPLEFLKGKKIGYPTRNIDFSIKHIMKKYHYDKNNLEFIYLKTGFISSFITHRVDAISNVWNIYEGELIRQHCPQAYFYPYIDIGLPNYADVVIIKAQNNNYSDESFKRALKKAIDFIRKYPDKAYSLTIKTHPELNTALNKKVWHKVIPLFSDEK